MKQKKAPHLLTLSAVCDMLSCSPQTVRRLRKKGLGTKGREGIYPVVFLTDDVRSLRFPLESVNRFLVNRSTSCPA